MRLHRFIGPFNLKEEELTITDSEIVKQMKLVLRLEVGDQMLMSDGQGQEAKVEITSIHKGRVEVKILESYDTKESNKETRKVSLYLAILKKENFELAVQKATECGVSKIIPVITERTIKTGLNIERLQKIIREASEQSGRSIVPTLGETLSFKEALEEGKASQEKIIFHLVKEECKPDGSQASVRPNSINIFIGPEGGFTEKEIALAEESGYRASSLGSLTLRGETAAIIATYRAVQGI